VLGGVHSLVGRNAQRLHVGSVFWEDRNAYAGADPDCMIAK
jgi:hypothetical protein